MTDLSEQDHNDAWWNSEQDRDHLRIITDEHKEEERKRRQQEIAKDRKLNHELFGEH